MHASHGHRHCAPFAQTEKCSVCGPDEVSAARCFRNKKEETRAHSNLAKYCDENRIEKGRHALDFMDSYSQNRTLTCTLTICIEVKMGGGMGGSIFRSIFGLGPSDIRYRYMGTRQSIFSHCPTWLYLYEHNAESSVSVPREIGRAHV